MIRTILRKWLGIRLLDDELEALIKHYQITLEPQPKYKVKTPNGMGFKAAEK